MSETEKFVAKIDEWGNAHTHTKGDRDGKRCMKCKTPEYRSEIYQSVVVIEYVGFQTASAIPSSPM